MKRVHSVHNDLSFKMALPMRKCFGLFVRNSIPHLVKKETHVYCYPVQACQKSFCTQSGQSNDSADVKPFDESLLEILVCPISKKPLRYDKEHNELVSDSIGVAFPIKNGMPNLVPIDGRILEKPKESGQ